MEASSYTEQKLTTFISQLLSGVVESVSQQGYQVAFLASKCGNGGNDILSLHGGLSLNIQKKLEVNFMSLIKETSHEADCSISQSGAEKIQSNHTVSIPSRDVLADTIKVECNSEFDASPPGYLPTDDTEYSQATEDEADEQIENDDGKRLDESQKQQMQSKPGAPSDLEIEHDQTQTWSNSVPDPIFQHLRGKKKNKSKEIHLLQKQTGEKRYACTECPYGTPKLINLRRHMMTHGEKPYACTNCPYRTTRLSSLKSHILTHTGEKPFACPQCPYRATQQSNMKIHMLTHTGEKPFACPECPYRSKYKHAVQMHILTHTGEKLFACPQCPYRAATQSNMKIHMLKHIGEKPFACPECPYRTRYKSDLKRHFLTHTGEKTVRLP